MNSRLQFGCLEFVEQLVVKPLSENIGWGRGCGLGVEILTRMSCFLIKFNEKAWKKGYKGPMTKDNDGSISIALEKARWKIEKKVRFYILHFYILVY